jgi:hypothetical protein
MASRIAQMASRDGGICRSSGRPVGCLCDVDQPRSVGISEKAIGYAGAVMLLDSGTIIGTSWNAVTIAWDNGRVATVHHGDMREIHSTSAKPKGA